MSAKTNKTTKIPSIHTAGILTVDVLQLLVLDPEKRIPLDQIPLHPWIVKHCVKGERVANREKSFK